MIKKLSILLIIISACSHTAKKLEVVHSLTDDVIAPTIKALDAFYKTNHRYPEKLDNLRPNYLTEEVTNHAIHSTSYYSNGTRYKLIVPNFGGLLQGCTYSSDKKWICEGCYGKPGNEKRLGTE